MISRKLFLWWLPVFLLTICTINLKAHEPDSVDGTIAQLCPYIEETPMGVYMQNQVSPRDANHLMRDVLSRVVSHVPGLLVGYYQHGMAYNLLLPLAGLAVFDVGISMGNYRKAHSELPGSITPGLLVDFLSAAYLSIYGISAASTTVPKGTKVFSAQFKVGLIFPLLFGWKYLTRTQTINTADIAYYRNRIVFKEAPANALVNKIAKYNGRLRMCSQAGDTAKSTTSSLAKFVVDHKQNNVPLMTHVYPWQDPCGNMEELEESERKSCQHIRKVQNLYEKIRKPNIRSRYKSSHRSTEGIVATFARPDLGLNMILLRPQTNMNYEIYEDALLPKEGWRMLELSDYDDYMTTVDIANDYFQYFVTVAGKEKYYVFLGMEVDPVTDDDGILTNTLIHLSPFSDISHHPSTVALPVEFNSRDDMLHFSEDLVELFNGSKHKQRVLLFKIESQDEVANSNDDTKSE